MRPSRARVRALGQPAVVSVAGAAGALGLLNGPLPCGERRRSGRKCRATQRLKSACVRAGRGRREDRRMELPDLRILEPGGHAESQGRELPPRPAAGHAWTGFCSAPRIWAKINGIMFKRRAASKRVRNGDRKSGVCTEMCRGCGPLVRAVREVPQREQLRRLGAAVVKDCARCGAEPQAGRARAASRVAAAGGPVAQSCQTHAPTGPAAWGVGTAAGGDGVEVIAAVAMAGTASGHRTTRRNRPGMARSGCGRSSWHLWNIGAAAGGGPARIGTEGAVVDGPPAAPGLDVCSLGSGGAWPKMRSVRGGTGGRERAVEPVEPVAGSG